MLEASTLFHPDPCLGDLGEERGVGRGSSGSGRISSSSRRSKEELVASLASKLGVGGHSFVRSLPISRAVRLGEGWWVGREAEAGQEGPNQTRWMPGLGLDVGRIRPGAAVRVERGKRGRREGEKERFEKQGKLGGENDVKRTCPLPLSGNGSTSTCLDLTCLVLSCLVQR